MKFIINPLNGTKHSLFSKQGKNLLKSYVKTYQTGGAAILDQTHILHILGCTPEILTGANEAENRTGRSIDGKSTKPIALLSEQCSYRTLSKDGKYPLMPDSTRTYLNTICNDHEHDGALKYHPHEGICLNADTGIADRNVSKLKKQIWKDIFKSLDNIFKNIEEAKRQKTKVVIVSHHNLIKKVLLGIPKKKGIANCACIEIRINRGQPQPQPQPQTNPNPEPKHQGYDGSIVDGYDQAVLRGGGDAPMRTRAKSKQITFHFIFTGYPDKKKYEYLNKLNPRLTQGSHWAKVDTTNIKNGLESHKNLPINFSIYLVRHGNAMHNKPMMDMLQKKHTKFYRPLDSSLTLLGLWQAKQLGKALKTHFTERKVKDPQIVCCASNLARAGATALAAKEQVEGLIVAPPLKEHYEQKKKESLERMTRRLNINTLEEAELIIDKLAKSLEEMLEGHSELQKSLPSEEINPVEDFKNMAREMLGEFFFSQPTQALEDKEKEVEEEETEEKVDEEVEEDDQSEKDEVKVDEVKVDEAKVDEEEVEDEEEDEEEGSVSKKGRDAETSSEFNLLSPTDTVDPSGIDLSLGSDE